MGNKTNPSNIGVSARPGCSVAHRPGRVGRRPSDGHRQERRGVVPRAPDSRTDDDDATRARPRLAHLGFSNF
jgi:hypothetical protein